MDALDVLLISERQESALFEQILLHSSNNVLATCVTSDEELQAYLAAKHPGCIIVDWQTEVVSPELFPRSLARSPHMQGTFLLALVYSPDQLHSAYRAGYHFVLTVEYTRATYYAISALVQLVQERWTLRQQLLHMEEALHTARQVELQWISVLERLMYQRIPESPMVAHFSRQSALWIAERLRTISPSYDVDLAQLELAARLYAIGRLQLGDADLRLPVARDGVPTTYGCSRVPESAAEALEALTEYPQTRRILMAMYENCDGTGFPHRLQGWQIPVGARILRVVVEYAELLWRDGYDPPQALSILQQLSHRIYDQRIVLLLDEYLAATDSSKSGALLLPLRVEHLVPGMVVGRDVVTVAGHKLVAQGTVLEASHIERIRNHHSLDPVLGAVYVLRT